MDNGVLRKRLRALREERRWSQDHLSDLMGFNDRQTLSSIEAGGRSVAAAELVKLSEVFQVNLNFFTDPYSLYGEGRFSWRQSNVDQAGLLDFERRAGRWVAAYRQLKAKRNDPPAPLMPRVGLTDKSTFEEAQILGEQVARFLGLGDVPATRMLDVVQEKLNTLVLHVDAIEGVSGAACQLPELNAIFINRNEAIGRRNYDLAHELFHLLTWDALPPKHFENERPTEYREKRIEQLAENFAAGLLMPSWALQPFLEARNGNDLHAWLNSTANSLGVTSVALKWRLVNRGALTQRESSSLNDDMLRHNGVPDQNQHPAPPLYSKQFMALIGWGIGNGFVSVRRASSLLDMTIDELLRLFNDFGIEPPFDL